MRLNYTNNNIVFSIIIYTKYNMILDYAKLFLIFFIIKNMYILKWAESIIFIKKIKMLGFVLKWLSKFQNKKPINFMILIYDAFRLF